MPVDALHPAQPAGRHDGEPGLFGHLPHDRVGEGLAPLDPAARDAPQPDPGTPTPPDQQQPAVVDDDAADADLGVRAQGPSSRNVVSSRAVMPDRS